MSLFKDAIINVINKISLQFINERRDQYTCQSVERMNVETRYYDLRRTAATGDKFFEMRAITGQSRRVQAV